MSYKNKQNKKKKTYPDQESVVEPKHKIATDKKKETKPIWVGKEKEKAESILIV